PGAPRRSLRRAVLRTDCPARLAPGSRGETRCARYASSARTVAASQKYEARFARRPRGCAARRRRHRRGAPGPAAPQRAVAERVAERTPRPPAAAGAGPLPNRARETSVAFVRGREACAANAATVPAKVWAKGRRSVRPATWAV